MKKALLAIAVVMLVAGTAFGSFTEYVSLGGIPMQYTTTDQVVTVYPSLIGDYSNQAVAEFGWDLWGYTMFDTEYGVFGLSASPFPPMFNSGIGYGYLPDSAVGVQYGTEIDGMKVGASLLFGSEVESGIVTADGASEDNWTYGRHAIALNLGATIEGEMPIDLSLGVMNVSRWSIEEELYVSGNLDESYASEAGGIGIALNARTAIDSWLINLGFQFDTLSRTITNKETSADDNVLTTHTISTREDLEISMNLGFAHVLKATDTLTITMGSDLNFNTTSPYSTKDENLIADTILYGPSNRDVGFDVTIPIYVAVEGKLNETWTVRGGVTSILFDSDSRTNESIDTDTGDVDETNYTYGSVETDNGLVNGTIGVTGTFGDLTVDALLNPFILLDGPYFISGSNNDLAVNIAVKYAWGN